jgi:glycosyltransferase involved in cell wall biosynthesis
VKILQIVSGQFVNGAMVHVNLLSRQLIERGHEVQLLCRPRSWIWRALRRTGIKRRKSDMNRFPPNELLRIGKWIREEKFDVIHTHMSRAHFFGVLLNRITGVPCVATAHASHFQLHWRYNDLVIANSESTKTFQARFNRVPLERLVKIPCFIDLEKFGNTSDSVRNHVRTRLGIHDQRRLIGVIGAVIERKGQRELIEALPALVERFPHLKVAFIGQMQFKEKYYRNLRKSLYSKKLFRRVIWVGRRNNVHELVQGLDACIVPSLKEPLGLCALEAMAAGVPVAAANVGGLREFVEPEQTGMLFNPRDPGDMSNTITRILTDQPLRDHLTSTAKKMVLDDFSPSSITTRIEEALASVAVKKVADRPHQLNRAA